MALTLVSNSFKDGGCAERFHLVSRFRLWLRRR